MILNSRCFLFAAAMLVFVGLTAGGALADSIKERMAARLPVIEALKAKGLVGENNKGYLEFRGSHRDRADVVDAENKDRRIIYSALAKREGTTTEFVGKLRAKQISSKADKGEWLQNAAGNWYRK